MRSIRGTLRVGLLLAAVAVFTAAGIATELGVRQALIDDLDRSLRERARWVASTVEWTEEGLDLGFKEFALYDFDPGAGASLLELWQNDGTVLYRSPSLRGVDLVRPGVDLGMEALAFESSPGGPHARTMRMRFRARVDPELEHPPVAPIVLISLGRDMARVDALLGRLRMLLVGVGLAATLLMLLFIRVVVRRSLRPLEQVATEIAGLDTNHLSGRVGSSAIPRELVPVVHRLNELLDRLNAAFERERTFSADVAHELRTPLAGIRTSMEVELSQPREAQSYRRTLSESLSLVLRMQGLVETLLQLARFDAGLIRAAPENLDLAELTRSLMGAAEPRATARGLTVHTSLEQATPVRADRALLATAIRNIVDNAISHADDRGRVRVEVTPEAGHARLRVSNSGAQMSTAELPRLFERFARGDTARAATGDHYGLGLSLVQRISDALGCQMDVHVEPDGTFCFTLDVPR